jgi:hypothetical protein
LLCSGNGFFCPAYAGGVFSCAQRELMIVRIGKWNG